jgi:hypothetical protein
VHTSAPVAGSYFPAAQAVHVPPSGPVQLRLQMQFVNATEPLGDWLFCPQTTQISDNVAPTVAECVLTLQFVHVEAPVPILYFPATHKEHAPPLDPVAPILQTQESIEVCDMSVCPEFTGQSSQAGLVVDKIQNAVKPGNLL